MSHLKDNEKKDKNLSGRRPGEDGSGEIPEENQKTVDTAFMQEQIKQRPVNKKKLLRRTLVTAFLAVLFGAIACAVFILLEPLISSRLNSNEQTQTQPVTIPQESQDEISPEQMIQSDAQMVEQEVDQKTQEQVQEQLQSEEFRKQVEDDIREDLKEEFHNSADISTIYNSLAQEAKEAQNSLVTVAGITQDYDWAGDLFENRSGSSSGVILADHEDEYYILTTASGLENAQQINVTFSDDTQVTGTLKAQDTVTGLSVITVAKSSLEDATKEVLAAASLGSSKRVDLLGQPVIAVGSPAGTQGSVSYGVVTNAALPIDVTDSYLEQITTDIYGSTRAAGALLDLSGNVIGLIDMSHNRSDSPNLISAIGITELKPLLEKLSNANQFSYLGIHATTVPEDVHERNGVPQGVYVTRVEMDGPAMEAGIQSGDVITGYRNNPIGTLSQLVTALQSSAPHGNVSITIERQNGMEYEEQDFMINPGRRLEIPD